tara:strand:- start:602 stop:1093 length:492 start_codon:yes stop_codon:yes gene_type:complete
MTTRKNTLKAGATHGDRDKNQERKLRALKGLTNAFCRVVDTCANATSKVRAVTPAAPESVQLSIVGLSSKIADMQHETSSKTGSWVASVLETQTAKECAARITVALTDAIVKSIKEGADNKKLIKANENMDKIIKNQDEKIAALEKVLDEAGIIIGVFSEEEE